MPLCKKNTETLLSRSLEVTTLGVLRSCLNSIGNYSQALLIHGGQERAKIQINQILKVTRERVKCFMLVCNVQGKVRGM